MELLAILIALALYGLWGSGGALQADGWFLGLREMLARACSGAALQLMTVALPAVSVALVHEGIDDTLFGLAQLALMVIVLLYSFGRGNLGAELAAYLERWSRGDFQAAMRLLDGEHGTEDAGAPGHAAELHLLARRRYYHRAYERRFAVLFWFVLLGPAGAIAYRGAALEGAQPASPGRIGLLHWLDWIPVRLLGISYALVGDFDACLYRWRGLLDDTRTSAELALEACGNAALHQHERASDAEESTDALIARGAAELDAVEVLHRRALLVWMVVIALLTMIG